MSKKRSEEHLSEALDTGDMVVFRTEDGKTQVEVSLKNETLWLSQKQMALLFDKDTDTIGLHLRNIFKEGELEETATTEESSVVQQEGRRKVRRNIRVYNLDAIISVGYRVTTPLWTAINGSQPSCSCGSWRKTKPSIALTAPNGSRTMPWYH